MTLIGHIGVVASAKTSGGGHVFASNLIRSLGENERVGKVTLFLHGGDGSFIPPPNVQVVNIPAASHDIQDKLTRGSRLRRVVRIYACDALLFPGAELTRTGSQPHLFWPLTVAPQEPATLSVLAPSFLKCLRWKMLRARIGQVAKRADAIVYSSAYTQSLYQDSYPGLAEHPSKVIWPAPSLSAPVPPERSVGSHSQCNILFVSHLYPYKMVTEMVSGFGLATQSGLVDANLLIAGNATDAEYNEKIRTAINLSGAADRIKMLGNVPVSDLDRLYRDADLFIFPSLSENAGSFALIDAFRYGVPVLSSDRSSMPEMCGDSVLYFNPESPSSLAHEILRVIRDRDLRTNLAARSQSQFKKFPTWKNIGDELIDFLEVL